MDNNSSNVVLRLENVTKQYKNFTAVNNVSFELEKGKIYAIPEVVAEIERLESAIVG